MEPSTDTGENAADMDAVARFYVKCVLWLGEHDPNFVERSASRRIESPVTPQTSLRPLIGSNPGTWTIRGGGAAPISRG